jgi:hypothetical protein
MLTRWYLALLYASVMVGKKYLTQNPQAGAEFEELMKDQIELMKAFTNRRMREQVNTMSTSEAATILQQAAGGEK